MLRVEGAIGLPYGEDEMEELAHAMADGDVAAFALGPEAVVQGADGGVVADSGSRGVPEVSAHEIVAFAAHVERTSGQGMALLVDAGAVFLGENAEVVDQLGGRRKAVDVHDLGDQDRGC